MRIYRLKAKAGHIIHIPEYKVASLMFNSEGGTLRAFTPYHSSSPSILNFCNSSEEIEGQVKRGLTYIELGDER